MQDLIRGIKKILGRDKKSAAPTVERVVVQGDGHAQEIAPLLKRAFLFLEDGEFDNADEYAEKVLDIDPECAEAYVAKLLIELHLKKPSDLAQYKTPISDSHNYQKAIRFASPEYRETIEGYNNAIIKRIDTARKDDVYARGVELMKLHRYDEAVQYFQKIPTYKDSTQKVDDCKKLAEAERRDGIYQKATQLLNAGQFDEAARLFGTIEDYEDAKEKIKLCGERKEIARKDAIYSQAMNRVRPQDANDVAIKKSIEELHTISGYRDADNQIRALNARLEKWYEDKKKAEEAARIKAEEERRTREREAELRRIKEEKTKKTVKKVAKIGIPSVAAMAVLLVLLFTLVISLIRYNTADELFNEGKYDEAKEIYNDLDGFSDSEQRITVLTGIEKIDDADFEEGIEKILSVGVPVKLTYGMGGGDFSGTTYLSAPEEENGSGIALLSVSTTSNVTPLAETTTASVPETVEYTYNSSADFIGLQTPGRSGYRFVEWVLEGCTYQIDGTFEMKLNAVWSEKEYTIKYDLNDGKGATKNPIEYGIEDDSFTLVNPTKTGYTFIGWTGTDLNELTMSVTIEKGSVGNRSYEANWQANTYTITLNPNGGSIANTTITVTYDQDYTLTDPEWAGHTFGGWYEDNKMVASGTWTRTSDLDLTAKWDIVEYDITYNMNSGTNSSSNPATYTVDDEVILVAPTRTGYTFAGWTYSGQATPTKNVTISAGTIGSLSYTANWDKNTYTVTFDANGGSVSPTSKTVTYDASYTVPTPTRTGYTFAGWYNGSTQYSGGTWKTASNTTLTAKWTANSGITYVVNHYKQNIYDDGYTIDSSATQKLTGTADASVRPAVKTYTGFTSPSAKTVTIAPDGSLVVDYYYTRNSYTITMVTNGGESITAIRQKYQSALTMPTAEREGYTFGGWYTDKALTTAFENTTITTSNITVYAHWSEENKPTDFTYSGTSAITVSAYNGTSTTMWVPAYIGGVPVTTISTSAFKDQTTIIKVVVPNSVTAWGYGIFEGCTAIEEMIIPFVGTQISDSYSLNYRTFDSLFTTSSYSTYQNTHIPASIRKVTITVQTAIPQYAFYDCKYIEEINIPESTTSIGSYAFSGCSALLRLNSTTDGVFNVPESVTSFGDALFEGCTCIEELTLPFMNKSATDTWRFDRLFESNNYNYNYYVPSSIKKVTITVQTAIPQYAFYDCKYIEEINIPENTTSIGSYAFSGCSALLRLNSTTDGVFNVPEGVTEINAYTFQNCLLAEVVNVGESIINIKDYAFAKCAAIRQFNSANDGEFILPESVRVISSHAFDGLSSIIKVVIPDSVSEIDNDAFKGCSSIAEITLPFVGQKEGVSSEYYAVFGYIFGYDTGSIYNHPSKRYDIPNSIKKVTITAQTVIPEYAFRNCNFIETIILPSAVTSVGTNSFYGCTANVTYTHSAITSIWNGTDNSTVFIGSGMETDPYQINSAADLAYLASSVNAGESYEGKYFVLNTNINLNTKSWVPIGTKNKAFAGTFDGNGKKIYNLSVTINTAYAGLFGYVSGTVKNLGVVSGTLAPTSQSATTYIGPLVAYLTGTVENCYSHAAVTTSITNIIYAGGLVGHVDSAAVVKNSYASGHVSAISTSGFAYAGGLVGANKGMIEGSLAFGDVKAQGSNNEYSRNGGFVAVNSGTLTECYRSESQILTKYTAIGGAYCDDGTAEMYSNMISYAKSNWSSSIWEYGLKYPNHK